MTFTADQVWGLAVRADTLNGGYFREDRWEYLEDQPKRTHTANKALVKRWLREDVQPTEAEVQQGREYRTYFNTFTMKALMGNITPFERHALRIAQMDEFKSNDMLEFAIVSCLPSAARREQANTDLKHEVFASDPLPGAVGDRIAGEITVVKSTWSSYYSKFKVVARMGESFVDFWHEKDLKDTVKIRAKIKQHRSDKTTQLNYVKVDRIAVR
jgi:hypothetical protein